MPVSNYPPVLCRMRLLLLTTILLSQSVIQMRFIIETLHHKDLSEENGAKESSENAETVVEEEGVDYADDEYDEEEDQRNNDPGNDKTVEEAGADYTDNDEDEEKDQKGNEPDKDGVSITKNLVKPNHKYHRHLNLVQMEMTT